MEKIHSNEKTLEILEGVKSLPRSSRVEMLQMINDLRPVAQVLIMDKQRNNMLPVIELLRSNGIAVSVGLYGGKGVVCFISKDKSLSEEALTLFSNTHITDHRRFGELMGFPPCSIESFANNDENDFFSDKEIEGIIGFKNKFLNSKLSKSNKEESIDYLKKSYKVLLEQSPDIFDDELRQKVSNFVYL